MSDNVVRGTKKWSSIPLMNTISFHMIAFQVQRALTQWQHRRCWITVYGDLLRYTLILPCALVCFITYLMKKNQV